MPTAHLVALGGAAYPTFSTFGYETFTLLRSERLGAAAYVGLSGAGGLAATAAGYAAGRAVA